MKRLLLLAWLASACTNEMTPEGYEGYVYHTPLVFGQAYFVASQTGPTSTGLVWRQHVINVDIRPKNYTEEFHILSRDNLNVGFHAHARISIRPGTVRRLVESYGSGDPFEGELPEWYMRAVRQRYRASVFDVVHRYNAYDVQIKTQEIGQQILQALRDAFAETPFEFETISIGNLSYPEEINAEIQRKLAAEQDLERMDRERQIAEQEAEITITTARGRAAAQRIVNETLTPLYVQHEMLEGFRRLSRSDRVTIVAAPTNDESPPIMLGLQQ
jgi:regulator of protease activity HflC (stomatin/prohibitin superfamily)